MSGAPDSFELIDLEREGALDEAGARRLGMVLRSHRAVALERALMRDFDRARAERPGDGGVDALVAGALDRFEADTPTTRMPALDAEAAAAVLAPTIDPAALEELDAPEPGLAPGSTRQWLAVVGAGRAKAPRARPLVDSTRQWLAVVGARRARWPARVASAAIVLFAVGVGFTARGLVAPEPPAPPTIVAKASPAEAPRRLGPGQLLHRAETAAARGHHRRAVRLYRRLLRRFPRSDAARVGRLGLGRVLLEDLDAPGDAAAAFDSFLSDHPDDALAQDAAVGRAQALERSGGDAVAAWRSIARRYPGTSAASIAAQRLRVRSE